MDTPPVEAGDPELAAFWLRFCRRLVAALQVIGGLSGLYDTVLAVQFSVSHIVLLLAFTLFAASVVGGILLAMDRPAGVKVSLVVQALQALQIVTDSLAYSFVCGVGLTLGLYSEDGSLGFILSWFYPARFAVSQGEVPYTDLTFTGVNLVAVFAIICLLYVRAAHAKQESGQAAVY